MNWHAWETNDRGTGAVLGSGGFMFNESNAPSSRSRYSAKRNRHHADFFCHAPEARQVSLVGDFNGWDPDATRMTRQPDGRWSVSLELSHGSHRYVFLVDGQRVLDPDALGITRNDRNERVSLRTIS